MTKVEITTFDKVENSVIRRRNQAMIMANLFEDNIPNKKKVTSARGAALVIAYFLKVPNADKAKTYENYRSIMEDRGFKEVACQ